MEGAKKHSRREFLRAAGLASVGITLAACVPPAPGITTQEPAAATEAATAPTAAPAAATEPVDIRLRTFLDIQGETPREQTLVWLIDQFQEENPNINVVVETIPYDQLNAKLIIENEAATAPEVSYVQPQGIGKLSVSNTLLPLDPFIDQWTQEKRDEFYAEGLWNSTVVKGKKLTMAIGIHTRCLYTNKDILQEAGLDPDSYPATLAEVVEMGKEMTGGDVYGMGMCFGTERATAEIFIYPMIWGFGGKALDEDGNPIFNNEAGVQAFDWNKDLVLTHKITPEDSLAMTYSELGQQFPEGRYGMVLEGSYRLSGWLERGMGPENMGAAPWPSIEAGKPSPMFTNSWDLAIASNTAPEKQEAAWKLVSYYFEPEVSKRYTIAEGSLPTLRSLLNEEEFQTPYHEAYAEVIASGGRGLPTTPWVEELDDLLISALHDIIIRDMPTQEALDNAAAEYAKISTA